MPRPIRTFVPRVTYHVIQRGHHQSTVFLDGLDFQTFLGLLARACSRQPIALHGYVLMSNHVHLMLTPAEPQALPKAMKTVDQQYTQHFNRRYTKTGCLWQSRYYAWPIQTERYWLTCLRYVELNPVRAGMVDEPAKYPWSSYAAHALGTANGLLTPHPLFEQLGRTPKDRQTAWRHVCQLPASGVEDWAEARCATRGLGV
ncbi:MAG: transposase [Acidimicrobiia bacterium]|nr:transposase [Acidimicrobiia bacterium]